MRRLIYVCMLLALAGPCTPARALQKNLGSQKWVVFAFDRTDNTPKTGDAAQITANLRIDGGAANAVDDTNPTELEDGYYVFDLSQAETNGDMITMCPASSTSDIQVIGTPQTLWTTPPYFSALSIESDGDLTKVNTLDGHTAQTGDSYARLGAPAGASVSADVAAVKAETASILEDTGTTLDGIVDSILEDTGTTLDGIVDDILEDTGTTLPATLATLDGIVDAILVDTGTTLDGIVDAILEDTGTTLDSIVDSILEDTGTTLPATLATVDGIVDDILVDTGTTLDGIVDAILVDTGTDGVVVASASKTGYGLASDGLDSIATTAPAGVASNFREMVVAIWRHLYKKTTFDSSTGYWKTYADDGTTTVTTQDCTTVTTVETKGAAY